MSLVFNGVKYPGITLTGDKALETYDADITPEDMQNGKTAYVKGKKLTGTGKCFEFAFYGSLFVEEISDADGNTIYGVKLNLGKGANVFLVSSYSGDIVIPYRMLYKLNDGESVQIGTNVTTGGKVYALHVGNTLTVYMTDISSIDTKINLFIGKDNQI